MQFLVIVATAVLVTVTTAIPTGKSFGVYTGSTRYAVAAPSIDSYGSVRLPAINVASSPSQKSYTTNTIQTVPLPVTTQPPVRHKSYTADVQPTVHVALPPPPPPPPVRVSAPTHKSYTVSAPVPVRAPTTYSIPAPARVSAKSYSFNVPASVPVRPQNVYTIPAPVHTRTYTTNLVPSVAVAAPYTKSQTSYSTRPYASVPQVKSYGANIIAPQRISYVQSTPEVVTSSRYHIQDHLGQYNYGYATSDGQARTEIRGIDGTVAGRYSYVDPNGKHVVMSYVADEDGFRVAGNNLPQAPELPEELAREYSLAHARLAAAKAKAALDGHDDDDGHHDDDDNDGHGGVKYVHQATVAVAPVSSSWIQLANVKASDGGGEDDDDDGHDDGQYVHHDDDDGHDDGQYVHQANIAVAPVSPSWIQLANVKAADGGEDNDDDDDGHDDGQYVHQANIGVAPVSTSWIQLANVKAVDGGEDDGGEDNDDDDGHDDGQYVHNPNDEGYDDGQYKHDDAGDKDKYDGDDNDDDNKGTDHKQTSYVIKTLQPGTVQQQAVNVPSAQTLTYTNPATYTTSSIGGGVQQVSAPVITSGVTVPARVQLPSVSQLYSVVGHTQGGAEIKSIGSGQLVPTSGQPIHVTSPQVVGNVGLQAVAQPQQPHAKSGYTYTG